MMLNNIAFQLQYTLQALQANVIFALLIISIIWFIQVFNAILGYKLNYLGILPRNIFGLLGIFFSPLLHANFEHIVFNSIPLFVLMDFVLLAGKEKFFIVSLLIIVMSGTLTWLFGRKALHVGASGIIAGYWGYLLVNAYKHPSLLTVVLAFVCIYYFGGVLLSLLPAEERISWEGHVFGLVAGLFAAYLFPLVI